MGSEELQKFQENAAIEKQELMHEMQTEIHQIQLEKENLVTVKNDLEIKLTALNGEISEVKLREKLLQDDLKTKDENLQEVKSKCDINYAELEFERLEKEKLQEELDSCKEIIKQADARMERFNGDVSLLQAELERKDAETANLGIVEEMVEQQKNELTEKEEEIKQLKLKNDQNMKL